MPIIGSAEKMLNLDQKSKTRCIIRLKQKLKLNPLTPGMH